MRGKDVLSSSVSLRLSEHGFAVRFVSLERLQELKDAIEKAHSEQLFDEGFYRYLLPWFDFRCFGNSLNIPPKAGEFPKSTDTVDSRSR